MKLEKSWTDFYTATSGLMYPAEAVIRIFKGDYPGLTMRKPDGSDGHVPDAILDIGCGDGRHFPLFDSLGMTCYGTEINEDICSATRKNLSRLGLNPIVRPALCDALPWKAYSFEYVMAWNSCYYMSRGSGDFHKHVADMARVLADDGYLICSVPTERCFIFDGCEIGEDPKYCTIVNDYFGMRNGEVMRMFIGRDDIEEEFGSHFEDFQHSTIDIDCFGVAYSWYVFVAKKKTIPAHPW